jgi:hypothetical protein
MITRQYGWRKSTQHRGSRTARTKEKLSTAAELHSEFSRYIEAHNQSDEMIQHSSAPIEKVKKDFGRLKAIAER